MAKLTLNDISGGYQTADAYNANNALTEAALENTLSLDGTTPNQMQADLDMNSYDVDNIGTLNATGFILNGVVVTPDVGLVLALDAPAVSFTPTNPAGAVTTLQDALDDDYLRNDRNETITGTLDVSGALTVASGGVTVDAGGMTITDGDVTLSAGNLVVSGTVDGRDLAADGAATDTLVAANAPSIAGKVYLNSSSSVVVSDSTLTDLPWDAVDFEPIDIWEGVTNPERITIPVGYTKIQMQLKLLWQAGSDWTKSRAVLYKNGSSNLAQDANANSEFYNAAGTINGENSVHTGWIDCVAGDYFEWKVEQQHTAAGTRYLFGGSTSACYCSVELAA